MPSRALRPCSSPGCGKPCSAGRCSAHPKVDTRGSARERGYGTPEWRRARAYFLKQHPLCECPIHKGREDAPIANTVDHIIPKQPTDLAFWDQDNWQALAHACHSRKTARHDGGYGHTKRAS